MTTKIEVGRYGAALGDLSEDDVEALEGIFEEGDVGQYFDGDNVIAIARDDDEVIGGVVESGGEEWSIAVDEGHQGSGIGTKLVKALIKSGATGFMVAGTDQGLEFLTALYSSLTDEEKESLDVPCWAELEEEYAENPPKPRYYIFSLRSSDRIPVILSDQDKNEQEAVERAKQFASDLFRRGESVEVSVRRAHPVQDPRFPNEWDWQPERDPVWIDVAEKVNPIRPNSEEATGYLNYWIDPYGDVYPVRPYRHAQIASVLEARGLVPPSARTLGYAPLDAGWLQVSTEPGRETTFNFDGEPTQRQLNAVFDLVMAHRQKSGNYHKDFVESSMRWLRSPTVTRNPKESKKMPREEWARLKQEAKNREDRRKQAAQLLRAHSIIAFNDGNKETFYLLHPSTTIPGGWQISFFDRRGPYSHQDGESLEEVFSRTFDIYLDPKEARPVSEAEFMQITASPEFVEGTKRVTMVGLENRLRFEFGYGDDVWQVISAAHEQLDLDSAIAVLQAGYQQLKASR